MEISSSNPEILTFSEIQYGGRRHLDFHDKWIWHVRLWWLYVSRWEQPTSVPDVRLLTPCKLTSATVFGYVGVSAWSSCTFISNFVQISSSSTEIIAFYKIQYGRRPPSWICWGKVWDYPRRPIHGGYPVWKFRNNRFSTIQFISISIFCRSSLKVLFMGPKFQFFGCDPKIFGNIAQTPKGTSVRGMTRFEPSLVQIGRAV